MGKLFRGIFRPKLDERELSRLAYVLDSRTDKCTERPFRALRAIIPVHAVIPDDMQGLLDRMV